MFSCSFAALGFVQMIEPPVDVIGTVNRAAMIKSGSKGSLSWRNHFKPELEGVHPKQVVECLVISLGPKMAVTCWIYPNTPSIGFTH